MMYNVYTDNKLVRDIYFREEKYYYYNLIFNTQ